MTNTLAHPDYQIVPGEAARLIGHLSQDEVIALYQETLAVTPDVRDEFYAFDIWETEKSKVVYTLPSKPGSNRFYEWVTKEENYYPTARAEWKLIADAIADLGPDQHVLDVGCGAGNLLDYLKTRTKATLHGLDATPSSVEACRAKGHAAHLGYLSDLLEGRENHGKFSAIIMTHVLEHVPKPIDVMSEAVVLLKRSGGKLLVSTPHSPTLYEASGYHGKNLPPHHLTRWRTTGYRCLAERFGLQVELKPLPSSFVSLVAGHFASSIRVKPKRRRLELILNAVKHPLALLRSIAAVSSRERASGKIIGNDVLGIFMFR
jgi:2-polyprenyl-3-methyl-5-hydroxy-6-metoxy-1,4-benzoquinol methylase